MKYRLIMFLTILAVLIGTCGCKKQQADDDEKNEVGKITQNIASDEIDYTSHLVDAKYDGYKFKIHLRPSQKNDVYVEEQSSEIVENAVYERNKLIEEMYDIEFVTIDATSGNYETDALKTILAGDDAYDVILPHSRAAFTYAVQGTLINWYDIPNVDLSKPWWIKDAMESFTVGDKLYVMDGDMCLHSLGFAACLFFNKNLFDDLGLDYPYELVREGKWTFDKFEELVMKGSKDLNGDGVMVPEDDRYGYVCSDWGGATTILYAGGQRILTNDENHIPQLTLNNEKTVNVFDRFFKLVSSDDAFCILETPKNYNGENHFKNDRALFTEGLLASIKTNRAMESDFGVLPYPKFDENDEYSTNINGFAHLICVPVTALSHIEKTGAILEAMAALGSRDVVPAFYEVALQTKYSRDDESAEMLDIVRNSRTYDLGYISGNTFASVGCTLARNANHDFSSYYAANESASYKSLQTFIESYTK